ncbi:NAD(P)H-dependent oxidoreductase [Williamsia sterculiae]|uniref:NAD(P)H dehydrogenase (Quinone) n=1 Tax=Williamsia sterculiae TaxID=1344003 RepID=A0A1N7GWH3_9NOCA|nr:NAD(P)H-dependent oxidoreductase [Williamsia sterculiae]SIS16912.1 NAD(P)H dehydrogenase (quinone) [Williamsia sterculiae]
MTTPTDALWVLANPDPNSLGHALSAVGAEHLRTSGSTVSLVDLYAERWDPVLSDADLPGATGQTLSDRQGQTTLSGNLPAEVVRQQELITGADLVVVQFPLWWYGMPAILKGWFDRVFTNGFAFGVRDDDGHVRKYGDGGLAGRRLLPVVTAGDRSEALGARGISGDIIDVLWPLLHGTAHYTGMTPLRPHLITSVHHLDSRQIDAEFDALRARIDHVFDEEPLVYRHLRGGDYTGNHELRDEIATHTPGFAAHLRPTISYAPERRSHCA